MTQLIDFAKVQATGNDFILIDGKQLRGKALTAGQISAYCHRQLGIGADGVIIVDAGPPVTMRYFNADGSEGEMCGNGLRAATLFSQVMGFAKKDEPYIIEAADGPHQVIYRPDATIRVEILNTGKAQNIDPDGLDLPDHLEVRGFINTGVPHLVIETEQELDTIDIFGLGKKLRNHLMFQPEGTNVNFIRVLSENRIAVRTYERGVEAETLSCGTGVTASSLLYRPANNGPLSRVEVETPGGLLKVIRKEGRLFLEGPARMVFAGHILMENT